MFINLNLDLCLHLFSISFLMFSKFIEGILLYSIINNFSVEHRLHLLVPHLYGLHFAIISHSILYSSSFSFKCTGAGAPSNKQTALVIRSCTGTKRRVNEQ